MFPMTFKPNILLTVKLITIQFSYSTRAQEGVPYVAKRCEQLRATSTLLKNAGESHGGTLGFAKQIIERVAQTTF